MAQHAKAEITQEISFTKAFSSFSVNDINIAKDFYSRTLRLNVQEQPEGISLQFDGDQNVFIYLKKDHQPANFTVLNFPVDDIKSTVEQLTEAGVKFESFDGDIATDDQHIFWGGKNGNGPNIAWFKDPAGNFLSVLETAE